MASAPYLPKSVTDAVRRYDRHLQILWCPRRNRFTMVRMGNGGVFNELHVFQGDLGEFVMPNEQGVQEWLSKGDVSRTPGFSWQDKVRNFIRRQNRRNDEIKEKERAAKRGAGAELLGEYVKVSKRNDGNFEATRKHMANRREVLKGDE